MAHSGNPSASPPGIRVVCVCTNLVTHLPSPEYDSIMDFPLQCSRCGNRFEITIDRGRVHRRVDHFIVRTDTLINTDIQGNVPESSAILQEGALAVNVGAFRAAAVMARAALEVCLDWAGFQEHSLAGKVGQAVVANVLTDYDKQVATNARLIGNFGAHGTCASYAPGDGEMKENESVYALRLASELVTKIIRSRVGGST